ncbi:1149_t:CDS:1, partial [Cetraspora pellucida]
AAEALTEFERKAVVDAGLFIVVFSFGGLVALLAVKEIGRCDGCSEGDTLSFVVSVFFRCDKENFFFELDTFCFKETCGFDFEDIDSALNLFEMLLLVVVAVEVVEVGEEGVLSGYTFIFFESTMLDTLNGQYMIKKQIQ